MKVTVADTTVLVSKPTAAEVRRNVKASSDALERAAARIIKPGVRLYPRKGVPLYSADPDRPGVYVRILDGRTDRGVLQRGAFKVVD